MINIFQDSLCGKSTLHLHLHLQLHLHVFIILGFRVNVRSSQADVQKAPKVFGEVDPSPLSSETTLDGWDGISLEYSLDWPLQLFFTQEVLTRYSSLIHEISHI